MTFTADSSWEEYLQAGFAIGAGQTGEPDEAKCVIMAHLRATVQAATCGEAFEQLWRVDKGWLIWGAMNTWDMVDADLQDQFVRIIATDPPSAAALYVMHPHLRDYHDRHLYAAFCHTMPVATAAIESGATGRAKNAHLG